MELIAALDYPDRNSAMKLVHDLGDECDFYKIGSTLFTATGPGLIEDLVGLEKHVFLDLKFHDIPNQVAGSVKSAAELGVSLITIHSSGGAEMIRAACEAASGYKNAPKILAVSVLTSLSEEDLLKIGMDGDMHTQVDRLSALAENFGADGVVCSVYESLSIKKKFPGLQTLCPGIRMEHDDVGDQSRVATPSDAQKAKADWIVLGRTLTKADNPLEKLRKIKKSLN